MLTNEVVIKVVETEHSTSEKQVFDVSALLTILLIIGLGYLLYRLTKSR